MPVAGDYSSYPYKAAKRDSVLMAATVDVGAAGAPTVSGDPGLGVTRASAGVYDITFPAFPSNGRARLRVWVMKSAAATVAVVIPLAFAPTLGTAQVRVILVTPGTPVDPANGDQLGLEIIGGVSGVD